MPSAPQARLQPTRNAQYMGPTCAVLHQNSSGKQWQSDTDVAIDKVTPHGAGTIVNLTG